MTVTDQYDDERHEQLNDGLAAIDAADDDPPTVRIVPIPEGERTVGASGEPTVWDRDPLETAVEQGAFDGATIVKGEGGQNPHFPMDEQVPPENILGRVDEWDYEPGVGPVGRTQLADDDIADRIDLGLLDVSPDMLRQLGDYDEERDGRQVDEILSVPRITVLERGAASNASIDLEPATAEALAVDPQTLFTGRVEYLQDDRTPQVGDAVRWESSAGGPTEPDDVRYGVVVDGLQDRPDDEVLVAVYQPATGDESGWEARGEQNPMSRDNLEVVGRDGVGSLPPIEQLFDEAAESVTRRGDDSTDMPDDNDLQEQLADARQRANTLESEKEQLAEKNESLEDELSEVRDDLSDAEDRLEQLAPLKRVLAEAAAGDSHLSAEQLTDRFTAGELIDSLADGDGGDDASPVDVVREQLAEDIAPRGDGDEGTEPVDDAETEQLAQSAMNVSDLRTATERDMSNREYLRDQYDVDPADYDNAEALRMAVRNGGD